MRRARLRTVSYLLDRSPVRHPLWLAPWLASVALTGSTNCRKAPAIATETSKEPSTVPPVVRKSGASIPNLDLRSIPAPTPADESLRGVFAALDGEWQGRFHIYLNQEGQNEGPVQPTRIDRTSFKHPPFALHSTIEVRQSYISESPLFQRVRIEDRLPSGEVVKSEGVNKVEGGKMWCLVKKPDDFVVHSGQLDGPQTIVWTRNRKQPLAIERFEERVTPQRYTIIGWGYYGNDDPQKAPRMYFEAEYVRPAQ